MKIKIRFSKRPFFGGESHNTLVMHFLEVDSFWITIHLDEQLNPEHHLCILLSPRIELFIDVYIFSEI